MATVSTTRGEVTRQRILDATLHVIATEGVRAVTQRRVAKEANASLGLITYYFDNTTTMITSTLEDLGPPRDAALRQSAGEGRAGR